MSSQYLEVYIVGDVSLRRIHHGDVILPDDKNNMNRACVVIRNKLDERLTLYGLVGQ